MHPTASFYENQPEPIQSCLLALREIILRMDPLMNETLKYGSPCFAFGKKLICYLWIDKKTKEPYMLMVDGNKLTHPELEAGNRKRMKILSIDPNQDIPLGLVQLVLKEALELHPRA